MPTIRRTLSITVHAAPESQLLADSIASIPEDGTPERLRDLRLRQASWNAPAMDAFRKTLAERHGVGYDEYGFRGALDDMLGLLDELVALRDAGTIVFRSAGIKDTVVDGPDVEWYAFAPKQAFSRRTRKRPLAEVAYDFDYHGSNRFRHAYDQLGLTGLAFARTAPIRYDARAWFRLAATRTGGRGAVPDPAHGVLASVAERVAPARFKVGATTALYRPLLPDADFVTMAQPSHGETFRAAGMRIRRSAAERCIEAGVLHPDDLEPVLVLDAPEPGMIVLDETEGPVPERFVRGLTVAANDDAAPEPAPDALPSLDEAFAAIERSGDALQRIEPWSRSMSPCPLPSSFADIAEAIGCATIGELEFFPPTRKGSTPMPPDDPLLPDRLVEIGGNGCGDWLAVPADDTIDDCPVFYVDHERNICDDYWPTIAAFIVDKLGSSDPT